MRFKFPVSLVAILFSHTLSANDCIPTAHRTTSTHYKPVSEQRKDIGKGTEWPNISPPHIHFIVTAKGYQVLETQWIGRQRQENISFIMVLEK